MSRELIARRVLFVCRIVILFPNTPGFFPHCKSRKDLISQTSQRFLILPSSGKPVQVPESCFFPEFKLKVFAHHHPHELKRRTIVGLILYQSVSICPLYNLTFHLRSNELLCLIDLFWFVCETEQSGQLQRANTGSTPNLKNDFPRPRTRLSLSKYGALPRVRGSRPRVCPSCLLCPHWRDVGEFPA